ncbi:MULTISPECIES: signal recognition particle-docking protein FtsY [unclassified Luteimonas]
MIRLFGRKKPDHETADDDRSGTGPGERKSRYSIEELAAAFPDAGAVAAPVESEQQSAPLQPPPPAQEPPSTPEPTGKPSTQPSIAVPSQESEAALPSPAPAELRAPSPLPPAPEPPPATQAAPVAPASPAAAVPIASAASGQPPTADSTPLAEPAPTTPPAAPGKTGWRDRLRGSVFARSVGGLFSRNPKLDDDLLDEIETALLTADVGVTATTQLVEQLRKRMKAREFADARAMLAALRADLIAMLQPVAKPLLIDRAARPFVILTVGVNGVGKTTTIGKLARRFKDEGRSLMLAAGDTFRAAAVAQLQAWGHRNGVAVIAQGQDADPASVAFDALQAAKSRGSEVLIADTAGRLHTQQGLMAELSKIRRVLGKIDPTAPHEVLMVIDGTTGQNALSQLRQFHAAVNVTGLVVTKLDGTAKGGVVFALAREFGIPIRFAGIGERPEDLRVFDAEAFVDALLPETLG